MSAAPWPPGHLYSLADWDALSEDESRNHEIVKRVLEVHASPTYPHQRVQRRLGRQLEDQLPDEFDWAPDVDVVLSRGWPVTVRTPDLIVVRTEFADTDPKRADASDVLLAVEIISPDSRKRDLVTKHFEYSEAGIPDYWVVDLDDPVTLTAYRLIDGEYEIVGSGESIVEVTEPAPLTISVDALLPHRK